MRDPEAMAMSECADALRKLGLHVGPAASCEEFVRHITTAANSAAKARELAEAEHKQKRKAGGLDLSTATIFPPGASEKARREKKARKKARKQQAYMIERAGLKSRSKC